MKIAGYNISLNDLRGALQESNVATDAVSLVDDNTEIEVVVGTFFVLTLVIIRILYYMYIQKRVYLITG